MNFQLNTFMNSFALFISSFFEPMVVIFLLALLGGRQAGLTGMSWIVYVVSLLFFVGFVAMMRLFFQRKDKTNWDVSDRKKRFVPLVFLIVFFGVQYFVVSNFALPVLSSLFLLLFLWSIGFFLLTLIIKLSGHLSILTLAVWQLVSWYGFAMLPLVLCIPLVSWSRISLKRHTVSEVIAGISYASILFLLSSIIG